MTSKRTMINLTFATDEHPGTVLASITDQLRPEARQALVHSSVNTFDMNEDDDPGEAAVVYHPLTTLLTFHPTAEKAEQAARETQGLALALPILADHRPKTDVVTIHARDLSCPKLRRVNEEDPAGPTLFGTHVIGFEAEVARRTETHINDCVFDNLGPDHPCK